MGFGFLEQVSFDLLEEYLESNQEAASWGKRVSGFRENALFQDYHGLLTFRKVQPFPQYVLHICIVYDQGLK